MSIRNVLLATGTKGGRGGVQGQYKLKCFFHFFHFVRPLEMSFLLLVCIKKDIKVSTNVRYLRS